MLPRTLAELIAKRDSLTNPQLVDLISQLKTLIPPPDDRRTTDDLLTFCEVMSKGKWGRAKHLAVLAEKLQTAEAGDLERLMVSMPPRHGKSELISYWFPIWLLARDPSRRIILVSYEHKVASRWGRRVRDFIRDFGSDLGLQLNPGVTAADSWELVTGGGMRSAGAGGPITGLGADCLIVDDPIKNEEEAGSEVQRENLWDWWQTTAFTRLEPPKGFVVMVATRWNQDDLLGRLEKQGQTGEGLPWDVLKLPALAEEDDPLERELEAPLWPERFPGEWYTQKRLGLSPYHWSALYQQRPTPEEGNAVKRRWWQMDQVLPDMESMDVVIQSWDLAFKDLKKSDYTVGQVWGRQGVSLYLYDQVRAHMNAEDVMLAIRAFTSKYPKALAKLIEDKANGPAVIAMLHKKLAGIIPVKVKASKDARLQAVVPLIAAGNVHLPHPETAPWVWDFVEEHAVFPNGPHDDMVDACTQALNYLQPQGWVAMTREERQEARERDKPQTTEEVNRRLVHEKVKKHAAKTTKRLNQITGMAWRRHRSNANW